MTQKENDLLIKDLCARVPYGVKFRYKYIVNFFHENYTTSTLIGILPPYHIIHSTFTGNGYLQIEKDEIKPDLFPMSSMTDEKVHEFYCRFVASDISFDDFVADYWNTNSLHKVMTTIDDVESIMDWYNKNHLDWRGLIPMGLANDATGLNIY